VAVAGVDGDRFAQRHPGCSAGAPAHGARPGALTRDRLTDTDLFTAPLTFMGVPHGRPGTGNRAAALGLVDCGNVRLTPGKIFDALERTEQAVARTSRPAQLRSPSVATGL
jgi:hypothetical protein